MNVQVTVPVCPWNEFAAPGWIRTSKQNPSCAPGAPIGLATCVAGTCATGRYDAAAPAMNTGVPLNAAALHVDDGLGPGIRTARYCSADASPPVGAADVSATVPPTVDVVVVRTLSHA